MIDPILINLTYKALVLILILSLPPVLMASLVGVLVSLVQAVTQVQDQTISFVFKLIAVMLTIVLTVRWLGEQLLIYANSIFDQIPSFLR
jgi:type III secretion protein S